MSPYVFLSIYSLRVPVDADGDVDAVADVVVATTNVVASSGRSVMTCEHFP